MTSSYLMQKCGKPRSTSGCTRNMPPAIAFTAETSTSVNVKLVQSQHRVVDSTEYTF